jgi:hypothetical protein
MPQPFLTVPYIFEKRDKNVLELNILSTAFKENHYVLLKQLSSK